MTVRIYVDEDAMDRDLVRALRARGIDVLTALEADMVNPTRASSLFGSSAILWASRRAVF